MNKLQMVQNIILTEVRRVGVCSIDDEKLQEAWNIADKIQAEVDERDKEEAEKKRKEMRDLLNADNTFIEKEGQHFDDVEWQPDWSQAPSWAEWYSVDKDGDSYFYNFKPYISDDSDYWADHNSVFKTGMSEHVNGSFGYTGDWRDSLRKRPQ